jgi:polar amino acid transport system substrate-binding protein
MLSIILISHNSIAHENSNIETYDNNILKVYTEDDFPPFNYNKDNKLVGFSVDIVEEILSTAKFRHTNVKALPWARSYHLTQMYPNSMLFTMHRTPEREDQFKWVGPIGKSQLVILMKKNNPEIIENFSIAAVRDSAEMFAIEKMGIEENRIVKINKPSLCLNLLNMDRVDACAISYVSAVKEMQLSKIDINNFYIYKTLSERGLFIAFNKDTPEEITNFFTEELDRIKKSLLYNELITKYGLEQK